MGKVILLLKTGKTVILATLLVISLAFTVVSHTVGAVSSVISAGLASIGASTVHGTLHKKVARQQDEIQDLRNHNNQMIAQRKKIAKKASSIIRRMKHRIAKIIATSTAAIPLESIPFAGLTTILATASTEAYVACGNMKDLAELESLYGIASDNVEREKVCGTEIPTKEELKNGWNEKWREIATAFKEWWDSLFQ